ncbi:hypothetical protein EDD15DRAFT_2155331 [Pisolithus albus]|nr:hypothetical protein EDD15DRAFT_2155331 [Pisolithus albus]
MCYCDAGDLQQLACTNHRQSEEVRAYLKHRLSCVANQYFANGDNFKAMLRSCDAIISGSTALHLLLPEYGTRWTPKDLDIYVPLATSTALLNRLHYEGYTIDNQVHMNDVSYTYSHVHEVVVLCKGPNKIDVVISRTSTALTPIFQFHSTVVMNFVSADTFFCSYPRLTLRRLSMVNAGPLYCSPHRRRVLDAVRKYQSRGIRYIHCQDFHGVKNTCKVSTRTVTDSSMMWISVEGLPQASHSFLDVFRQFGVLDVQWNLGGIACGLESAFCRPRVEVIEDESSVALFIT